MGGRVGLAAHRIARLGDDRIAPGYHRPDRNLPGRGRLVGEIERPAHRRRKRKAHASRLAQASRPVSYMAPLAVGAAWFCAAGAWAALSPSAGFTLSSGTVTLAARV